MISVNIPVKELKKCLNKVSFATLKNTEDKYYEFFSDICFIPLWYGIDFVASNGKLIAVYSVITEPPPVEIREEQYRLPKNAVEYLLDLKDEKVIFKFDLSNSKLTLQSGACSITTDLSYCGFPDYRDVLLDRNNANIEAIVDRLTFYQAVTDNKEVELIYWESKSKKFESLELIVNSLYLQQALENLNEHDRISLKFLDNTHQFSIHSPAFDEIYLMLPEKEIIPEYKRMLISKEKISIKEVMGYVKFR